MEQIVDGEFSITPKRHVLRFDAVDQEKSAIRTLYINTEAVEKIAGNRKTLRIAVSVE